MISVYFVRKMDLSHFHQNPKIVSLYLTHLSTKEVKMSTLKTKIGINRCDT